MATPSPPSIEALAHEIAHSMPESMRAEFMATMQAAIDDGSIARMFGIQAVDLWDRVLARVRLKVQETHA